MPRSYDDDDSDDDDIVRRPRLRRENSDISARTLGPGIALMAVSVVSLAVFTVVCPLNFIGILNKPNIPGKEAERFGNFVGAGCVPFFMISHLIVGVGGYMMYRRSSYAMAMTATILALLPCFSPCYLIGIPFGIWALVVLIDPNVKEDFQA